jgi:hypothetical protein
MKLRTGFIWLKKWPLAGFLGHRYEDFDPIEGGRFLEQLSDY